MKELLEGLVAVFNERARTDPKVAEELEGFERTVSVELADGRAYHFTVKDKHIDGIRDGPAKDAGITIESDEATIVGLAKREIGPFKALFSGKLKLKGDVEDLVRFRKFF